MIRKRQFARLALPIMCVFFLVMGCGVPTLFRPESTATNTPDYVAIVLSRTPRQDATEIIILPTATPTLPPTETALPTSTMTITATQIPCNWAQYVGDLSYPDDSIVIEEKVFVKTWRLKNIGTCTWNSNYRVVFSEGEKMGVDLNGVPLTTGTVPPGGYVDVSISLTAPAETGSYEAYFKLRSPDGALFGVGADSSGSFWVKIQSAHITDTPTKTPEN
jgi:hypothetical protein